MSPKKPHSVTIRAASLRALFSNMSHVTGFPKTFTTRELLDFPREELIWANNRLDAYRAQQKRKAQE